jgi:acetyl esterase/lipase
MLFKSKFVFLKNLLIITILFVKLPVLAQNNQIKIYPTFAPGTEGLPDSEKVVNERIYNVYQPTLTAFLPAKPDSKRPGIIVMPGGGYTHLAINIEGYQIAKWLNDHGIAAFVLKYRLNPVDALQDAKRSLSFIRFYAKKFGINPENIGVMGFSAGGNLGLNLCTHFSKNHFTDSIDSVNCKPDFMVLGYPWTQELYKDVTNNTSPAFIFQANDDKTVPIEQNINLYESLYKNNVPVEIHIFEKGGHGFGLGKDKGPVKNWTNRCLDWMRTEGIISK